jgi:hypothetical protein
LLTSRGMLPKLFLLLGRLMIWAWILTGPWDGDVYRPDVNGTWRSPPAPSSAAVITIAYTGA